MCQNSNNLYEFGSFRLDPGRRLLLRDGARVPVTPKAFDLLVVLVNHPGKLLQRDTLLELVWRDALVEEGNLSVCICHLRKVLGDDLGKNEYIETVSKRGYRFVAQVAVVRLALDSESLEKKGPEPSGQIITNGMLDSPDVASHSGLGEVIRIKKISLVLRSLAFSALVLLTIVEARHLVMGMRGSHSTANAAPITSLAVLPFETVGISETDNFVGLGTADALITRLGHTDKIRVRATSAVERYRNRAPSPQIAGKEQAVDTVLTGKIERHGDLARLTVQMIRVRDGSQLWSDEFDEKFTNAFALEDEVSDRVAHSIDVHMLGEEEKQLTRRSPEMTRANEAYLKGRYFWNKRTAASVQKGLEYFREAIRLDPNSAEAYQGVADSYAILGLYSVIAPEKAYPAARDAAQKSLQLNSRMAGPHATLGLIDLYYDWNGQKAQDEFTQAIKLDPNCAIAHSWSGEDLAAMGRFSEAVAEANLAVSEEPASPIISTNAGWTYYLAGRNDEAIGLLMKAVELDPTFPRAHFRLGIVYENRGRYDQAIAELNKAVQLSGGDFYYESGLGHAYAAAGRTSEARQILSSLARQSKHQYVPGFAIALVYAGLNEDSAAFQWLDKASDDHSASMAYLKVDPELSGLRSDSRFANVARHISF